MRACYAAWAISFTGTLAGCGATSGGAARGPDFPSQAKLVELAGNGEARERGDSRPTLAVDDWQLSADAVPPSAAEQLAQRVAKEQGSAAQLEPELACTAREIARFYGAHDAFPDQQLQAHMAGACGATMPSFGVMVWSTPTETVADTARAAQWHDSIAKQLGPWLPKSTRLLGAAELVEGKNTVFAATVGESEITWEARSPVASDSGTIELSGSLRSQAAFVYGLANSGEYGVNDCRTDPRVAPPRFRVTCALDPNDTSAWVDLMALPPGRVLARGVARLLVRRPGAAIAFSAKAKSPEAEHVQNSAAFSQRMLALINETRRTAGLAPLQLSPRESQTSQRLAGRYFENRADTDVSETIALGLIAGWDVQGTIRTGNFFSNSLTGSLDPKRWLGFMLQQPSARRVLLDAQARSIAIGPDVHVPTKSVGALLSTYSFYDSDDHRGDVELFVSRLNERRRGLGLQPAKVTETPEVMKAVKAVKTSHDPEDALQTAMQNVLHLAPGGVQGFSIEATDLSYVELPEALLRPQVTIALGAAHHRHPEAAWGSLVVLVVVLESSARPQTASAASVHRHH